MAHALHADAPNKLMHFDFLREGKSSQGLTHVLIIKGDASSFARLQPCEAADAITAAEALMKWLSLFAVVSAWVSDRGAHFKNAIMSELSRRLHAHQRFAAPCCPQSHGAAETACKAALRACRALFSELRMAKSEWPLVMQLMQSILNHAMRPAQGDRAPIAAFMGLPADNPLRSVMPPAVEEMQSIDFLKAKRIAKIENAIKALDAMRKGISKRRAKKRKGAVKRPNERARAQPVNFELGDFALVAKKDARDGQKLQVTWKGPRRASRAVSDLICECEDLITGKESLFHANRLKRCADSSLNAAEEFLGAMQRKYPQLQAVEQALRLRFNPGLERCEGQVKRRGFEREEPAWEPCATMLEDIPGVMAAFLGERQSQKLASTAKNASGV